MNTSINQQAVHDQATEDRPIDDRASNDRASSDRAINDQAMSVIFAIAQHIESRDSFGGGHCARVSHCAVRFGKSLRLSSDDLESLRVGGLVHDIGKIGVPDAILYKPGPLDPEEARIIKQHPVLGEKICAPLKSLRHVLPMIRHHHERMNGTGYPDGLQGDAIPKTVRILQVVDICDALTSDRSYRKNLSLPDALTVLREEADRGWLDQFLISKFASFVAGARGSVALGNRGKIPPRKAAKKGASEFSISS
jgi:putative two-component system response regulator